MPRILLCDDEMPILKAAEIKFRRSGFEVQCAHDGREAWEWLQQTDTLPDVIVTDCQMPYMDGISLAQNIQGESRFQQIPIMMLSAKGFELSEEQLRTEFGIQRVFGKPFSPKSLLDAVNELIGVTS